MLSVGAHEDERLGVVLRAFDCRSDRYAKRVVVGVKVITREEGGQSVMIALQDPKEGQDNGDTGATIQRLLDDTGIARVG
jgi:hypothetical protein